MHATADDLLANVRDVPPRKVADGMTPGGCTYEQAFTAEHGGTIDAPSIAAGPDGRPRPLDRLIRPPSSSTCRTPANATLIIRSPSTICSRGSARRLCRRIDPAPPHRLLGALARRVARLGTAERGEATVWLHFPGLHPDAAR
jgi:hypothetical protein